MYVISVRYLFFNLDIDLTNNILYVTHQVLTVISIRNAYEY